MKKTILFGLLLLVSFLGHSQTTNQIPKYPEKYTIDKADSLVLLKDYEKAVWYLINIYGTEPKIAEKKIKSLKKEIPDLDLLIKQTFTVYSFSDPEISNFSNGNLKIDGTKMKLKGSWGDALIEIAKK